MHQHATSYYSRSAPQKFHGNPHFKRFINFYDKYMLLIAIVGPIVIYLQAAMIIQNGSSENISLPAIILLLIVSASILLYGLLWSSTIISISGLELTVGSIVCLVAITSYKSTTTPGAFIASSI